MMTPRRVCRAEGFLRHDRPRDNSGKIIRSSLLPGEFRMKSVAIPLVPIIRSHYRMDSPLIRERADLSHYLR